MPALWFKAAAALPSGPFFFKLSCGSADIPLWLNAGLGGLPLSSRGVLTEKGVIQNQPPCG
jgi:hypothetical protein